MRGVVIVSGTAYGDGGGAIPGASRLPHDDAGNLIMIGPGQQHWSTVHVADLADFFRRVLEDDSARGRYVVGDGVNLTVAELTEAAAVAVARRGGTRFRCEARARLGDYFAEVLLLDQGTDAAKARPNSAGLRPIRRLSTSSAMAATVSDSQVTGHRGSVAGARLGVPAICLCLTCRSRTRELVALPDRRAGLLPLYSPRATRMTRPCFSSPSR